MIQASTIEFLQKGKNLLAISGGIDSMVLANLLIQQSISLECAHVNFGLRGKESEEDEEFVRKWATQNNITLHVNRGFILSKNKKETLQVQARNFRYHWFYELAETFRFHQIVTAHHHTDNVETLLIQLLQGGSLAALKGIEPQLNLLSRPLIHVNRTKIEQYALRHQIEFRQDSSNEKDDYLRNKLRHHILPLLQSFAGNNDIISPSVFDHLRTAFNINKNAAEQFKKSALVSTPNHDYFLKADVLNHFDPYWALFTLTQQVGLHFSQQSKLMELITSSFKTGKKIITASHELEIRADRVLIIDKNKTFPLFDVSHLRFEYFDVENVTNLKTNSNEAFFDADLVNKIELSIRNWQKGDFFFPFGMVGSKLLSDFFANQKMSSKEKDFQPLLFLNGDLVWVINRRIDKRFAVTSKTKKVLKITLNPM